MKQYSKKVQREIDILEKELLEVQKMVGSRTIIKLQDQTAIIDYLRRARQVGDTFKDL